MDLLTLQEDSFSLPSGGIPYKDLTRISLISGSTVKIRPIVYGDQRYITSWANSGNLYTFFHGIFSRLLTNPRDPDYDSFLLSDITAVLFASKLLTYGPIWKVEYMCPGCDRRQFPKIDLTKIKIKTHADFESAGGFVHENIHVTLPKLGKEVVVHLPRLKDEKETQKHLQNYSSRGLIMNEAQDRQILRLCSLIDTIDKQPRSTDIKFRFLEGLSNTDVAAIESAIVDGDTGLMTQDLECTCTNCGFVAMAPMSLGPDFFRAPSPEPRQPEGDTVSDGDLRRILTPGNSSDDRIGNDPEVADLLGLQGDGKQGDGGGNEAEQTVKEDAQLEVS